jgi:hypothetical protein
MSLLTYILDVSVSNLTQSTTFSERVEHMNREFLEMSLDVCLIVIVLLANKVIFQDFCKSWQNVRK